MTDNTVVDVLRKPFPASSVGKLPRLNCKDCSDNKQQKHCSKHKMIKCTECDNWISEKHIHLDYVGHAEVTDRLLSADPTWFWEPMSFDATGLPALDRNGGLWIRLTVGGVTRPGYGDAQGNSGPNAIKEAIGDALRNAAMRFGVALDLWAKSDLDNGETTPPQPEPLTEETTDLTPVVAQLSQSERTMLRDAWKSDYAFAASAVPLSMQRECTTLIESYVGVSPDAE